MRVTLLKFEGDPGVPLLNFGGGPGVPLSNFREVPGPTFKLWGRSQGPGTRGYGPTFTPCSEYSVTCSITTEVKSFAGIFQRICQNFKTRKQEILILKCFSSSSLSAFCKIGVVKTSAKFLRKHICWSLFSKSCRP